MKTPRDISGKELTKLPKVFGYNVVRQNGIHIMITTLQQGEHHLAIPNHNPLKVGTLNGLFSNVANHFQLTKEQVIHRLFG